MAISFVNQASAINSSTTLPAGLVIGDLVLVYAYIGAAITPSTAVGYTSISTQNANSNAHKFAYKFMTAADIAGNTTGTWTNAASVTAVAYRGVMAVANASGTTSVSGTTDNILAVSLSLATGNAWVVTATGSTQATSMSTPAGMTLESSLNGTTFMVIVADTGTGVTTFGATSSTLGSSANAASASVELIPNPGKPRTALLRPHPFSPGFAR